MSFLQIINCLQNFFSDERLNLLQSLLQLANLLYAHEKENTCACTQEVRVVARGAFSRATFSREESGSGFVDTVAGGKGRQKREGGKGVVNITQIRDRRRPTQKGELEREETRVNQ